MVNLTLNFFKAADFCRYLFRLNVKKINDDSISKKFTSRVFRHFFLNLIYQTMKKIEKNQKKSFF